MEDGRRRVTELVREMADERLYQIIVSNPRDREKIAKVKIRPVMLKGNLLFQETAYVGNQVFHRNFEKEALAQIKRAGASFVLEVWHNRLLHYAQKIIAFRLKFREKYSKI